MADVAFEEPADIGHAGAELLAELALIELRRLAGLATLQLAGKVALRVSS